MQIKFTDTALSDLQQIKNYISLDSPQSVRIFINKVIEKLKFSCSLGIGLPICFAWRIHPYRRKSIP